MCHFTGFFERISRVEITLEVIIKFFYFSFQESLRGLVVMSSDMKQGPQARILTTMRVFIIIIIIYFIFLL